MYCHGRKWKKIRTQSSNDCHGRKRKKISTQSPNGLDLIWFKHVIQKEKCAQERKDIEQPVTGDIAVEEKDIYRRHAGWPVTLMTSKVYSTEMLAQLIHTTHTCLEEYCVALRHAETHMLTCIALSLFFRNKCVIWFQLWILMVGTQF